MKPWIVATIFHAAIVASAAEPLATFVASAKEADRIVLCWQDDFPVEKVGITRIKHLYIGQAQITVSLRHLVADTTPHPASGVDKDGHRWIDADAVMCQDLDHFTHRLRAYRGEQCVAEMLVALDGRHVALIYRNERIRVTDDTIDWLIAEADWRRDFEVIQKFEEKKEANQALVPTATSVTPAADAPVAPAAAAAHL